MVGPKRPKPRVLLFSIFFLQSRITKKKKKKPIKATVASLNEDLKQITEKLIILSKYPTINFNYILF